MFGDVCKCCGANEVVGWNENTFINANLKTADTLQSRSITERSLGVAFVGVVVMDGRLGVGNLRRWSDDYNGVIKYNGVMINFI